MATPDEIYEFRKTAIGHLGAALRIIETVGDQPLDADVVGRAESSPRALSQRSRL